MADYYPLIARAIAGLDPSAPGESRRALYERARAALIQQLRSVDPPLSEFEITRERLSLEEAVRKVESEAAQRAREASRSGGASGSSARDSFRRANAQAGRRTGRRPPGRAPAPRRRARRRRPPPADGSAPRNAPPPIAPRPQPPQPQVPMADPQLPPRERGPRRSSFENTPPPVPGQQAPGMRGFRDIAADADDLGRAAAQANRNARKTYANVPSPSPEFDRLEPNMENRGADPEQPYAWDDSRRGHRALDAAGGRRRCRSRRRARASARPASASRSARARARCFRSRARSPIGVVLILVGAGILWGKSVVNTVTGLFKSQPAVEAPQGHRGARRPRGRRFRIASASRRRRTMSRPWRSASCSMTRIRPIRRASNMSAR